MRLVETFNTKVRNHTTKGEIRKNRLDGFIPGIVYGGSEKPSMISIETKQVLQASQKSGFFSTVYKISNTDEEVIVREMQTHPVSDLPLHIDFQRITKNSKIHVAVPLIFVNEDKSPGIKLGGVLNIVMHKIDLTCPPNSIPEKLEIDLTGLPINTSIHLDALNLPEGVKVSHPEKGNTIATIIAPTSGSSEDNTNTPAAK